MHPSPFQFQTRHTARLVSALRAPALLRGLAGLLLAGVLSLPSAQAQPLLQNANPAPGNVVISQVYGGGGSASGASYHNDYIELFNRTGSPISLAGLSVQYANAAASVWSVTELTGTIPAKGYYLVQEASQGVFGDRLPAANDEGTINIYHLNGKVALVSGTAPLSGVCPKNGILDLVGYGSLANCFEGAAPAPPASMKTAALRKMGGCTDTNRNNLDFAPPATLPVPRNSTSPANDGC